MLYFKPLQIIFIIIFALVAFVSLSYRNSLSLCKAPSFWSYHFRFVVILFFLHEALSLWLVMIISFHSFASDDKVVGNNEIDLVDVKDARVEKRRRWYGTNNKASQ